jgi:DNA polymerase (family 10)
MHGKKYNTVMDNLEIAAVFKRIAILAEIKGEDRFKVSAYQRAAESIAVMTEDLSSMDEKELVALPGIGQAIAAKIHELTSTGKLGFLERLEAEIPAGLVDLIAIPDVGPRKAALFWKELDITSVDELEQAARAGKLRGLPGMGEKSEARILKGIETFKGTG